MDVFLLDYVNVLVFTGAAVAFIFGALIASRYVWFIQRPRPQATDAPDRHGDKWEIYECGEPTIGRAWVRFDIRFYTIALLFIVFDVEIAFLYPWSTILRDFAAADSALGWAAAIEVFVFLLILGIGFVYCWVKGDLVWIKAYAESKRRALADKESAA